MSKFYVRNGIHYGTADEMIDLIEELEAKLAKAADALFVTDRWLEEMDMYESPDYHFAPGLQMVREALNQLTGKPR